MNGAVRRRRRAIQGASFGAFGFTRVGAALAQMRPSLYRSGENIRHKDRGTSVRQIHERQTATDTQTYIHVKYAPHKSGQTETETETMADADRREDA